MKPLNSLALGAFLASGCVSQQEREAALIKTTVNEVTAACERILRQGQERGVRPTRQVMPWGEASWTLQLPQNNRQDEECRCEYSVQSAEDYRCRITMLTRMTDGTSAVNLGPTEVYSAVRNGLAIGTGVSSTTKEGSNYLRTLNKIDGVHEKLRDTFQRGMDLTK